MARLDEWFESEIEDLKALAVAATDVKEIETFKARALQVLIMQQHMQAETLRLLDKAAKR